MLQEPLATPEQRKAELDAKHRPLLEKTGLTGSLKSDRTADFFFRIILGFEVSGLARNASEKNSEVKGVESLDKRLCAKECCRLDFLFPTGLPLTKRGHLFQLSSVSALKAKRE